MRSFIIHIPGDVNRAPNVARLESFLPRAEVMPAVAGSEALAAGTVRLRPGDLYAPRYPFALGAGEVGCFLSHRACWRRIVQDDADCALIVEDDMAPDPALWPDVAALVAGHAGPDSYIRLPAKAGEKPAAMIDSRGAARLFLPRVIGLQTVAQVVGRRAAGRLLAASETLDRPVDTLVQMHWITGQPVHTIWPNGVRELTGELGGSTIQKKNPGGNRLRREVLRAHYRARVAARPQRP
ncbi:MAG: glycosyltransferase family 25 protein [Jhaorihella sp.]